MATSAVAVHPTSRLPHAPRPLLLGAIALAGVALGVVELALAIPHDGNDIQIALLLWITLPYIAAGLIAWWRRPDSRLGPLMVAGGFAIGISSLQLADDLTITTIGALFDILPVAIFLHVYLAFPDDPDQSFLVLDQTLTEPAGGAVNELNALGIHHFGMWVEDVDAVIDRAATAGFTPYIGPIDVDTLDYGEPAGGVIRTVLFRDPDGSIVQLDQRVG